jgi:hypothetical protein
MRALVFAALLFGLVTITGIAAADTTPPTLAFEPPTPANNSVIDRNYVEVKVSMENAADLKTFVFNWNGKDYSIYDDSLVLQMNFNNNPAIGESNTKAVDVSRYGNNGTIYGAAYVDGKYGKALQFDGINDYVEVQNVNGIDVSLSGNLTIVAWIKKPSQDWWFDSIVTTQAFRFQIDSGKRIHWAWTSGGWRSSWTQSTKSITLNTWHHVVGVKKGNTITFYLDGEPAGGGTIWHTRPASTLRIGVDGLSGIGAIDYFTGTIDDVRIYNKALTPEEVKMLYYSTFWKHNPSTWKFYANITGLSDGRYTFYALAKDTSGNERKSDTRHITVGTTTPIPEFPAILIPAMIAMGAILLVRRYT